MKRIYVMVAVMAACVVSMTACSEKNQQTSGAEGGATSGAVEQKKTEVSNDTDGAKIDYEKSGVLVLGTYKGIKLKKKELKEEDMTEEEVAADMAWEIVVEESDVEEYDEALVNEEYENVKKQYEGMAELFGSTLEDVMAQFGTDDEGLHEMAYDQVKQRMIAKTIMTKEKLSLKDEEYESLLSTYMEEEEDKSKDELEEQFRQDYGNRPKDDMYIEYVKKYVATQAQIK